MQLAMKIKESGKTTVGHARIFHKIRDTCVFYGEIVAISNVLTSRCNARHLALGRRSAKFIVSEGSSEMLKETMWAVADAFCLIVAQFTYHFSIVEIKV